MINNSVLFALSLIFLLCSVTPIVAGSSNQKDDPELILQIAPSMREGLNFTGKGEYEKAITAYTKVLQFPKNSLTYIVLLNRGSAYLQLKQYDAALEDIERAILLEPRNSLAYEAQGYVYWETKQMNNVITSLTKSINLGLLKGMDFYIRGNAYGYIGDYERGIADLNTAIQLGFIRPETYINRGYLYENLGDYEKARLDFSQSLEMAPNNPNGLSRRAGVLRCLGKPQEAIADYNSIVQREPLNVEARLQRASTFFEIEEYEAALKDIEFLNSMKLDHAYKEIILANVYHRLGDLGNALKATEVSIKNENQDVQTASLFQRGLFLFKQGNSVESKKTYKKALLHSQSIKNFGRLHEAIQILTAMDRIPSQFLETKKEILEMLNAVKIPASVRKEIDRTQCNKWEAKIGPPQI